MNNIFVETSAVQRQPPVVTARPVVTLTAVKQSLIAAAGDGSNGCYKRYCGPFALASRSASHRRPLLFNSNSQCRPTADPGDMSSSRKKGCRFRVLEMSRLPPARKVPDRKGVRQ
ncbi:hypothetical protein ACSFA0_16240 [Variovorax sp. LT1P1]|uniref:hypothetical protein n=1 Tax=Variovorax sp. LT1P1 TaxID=3443730 RepID=UPI003F46D72A